LLVVEEIPVTSYLTICCVYQTKCGIYIALSSHITREGGQTMTLMRNYMVFIHAPESAMVMRVDVVRAFSRRSAFKKLQRQGFKKKRF